LPAVFATPEMRIPCLESEKFGLVDAVANAVRLETDANISEVNTIDGIRVTNDDGWWLIRASNTGAELVARAEGKNETALNRLQNMIYQRLQAAGWQDQRTPTEESN